MKYLLPGEKMLIRRDLLEAVRGEQGCDVVLHWVEEAGSKDVYGKSTEETAQTLTVRALVFPASQRADRAKDVERRSQADNHIGDVSICFLPEVDLANKKGLWFEVPGLANYVPDAKGLLAVTPSSPFFVSGQPMIREISCKVRT